MFTAERYGWIRVICDQDANKLAIRHVQRRLRTWGYYRGPESGAFDAATAGAVRRFQQERRIEHGGYLSYATMAALDGQPQAAAPTYPQPAFTQGPPPSPYGAPIFAPPAWPCGVPVCAPPGPAPLDTGRPPYLSWPDKSRY
jgi:peptidoglycan hydrolase-like protein with peptidoglycan-binding domain